MGISLYENYIFSTILMPFNFSSIKKIAQKQTLQICTFGKQTEGLRKNGISAQVIHFGEIYSICAALEIL